MKIRLRALTALLFLTPIICLKGMEMEMIAQKNANEKFPRIYNETGEYLQFKLRCKISKTSLVFTDHAIDLENNEWIEFAQTGFSEVTHHGVVAADAGNEWSICFNESNSFSPIAPKKDVYVLKDSKGRVNYRTCSVEKRKMIQCLDKNFEKRIGCGTQRTKK